MTAEKSYSFTVSYAIPTKPELTKLINSIFTLNVGCFKPSVNVTESPINVNSYEEIPTLNNTLKI